MVPARRTPQAACSGRTPPRPVPPISQSPARPTLNHPSRVATHPVALKEPGQAPAVGWVLAAITTLTSSPRGPATPGTPPSDPPHLIPRYPNRGPPGQSPPAHPPAKRLRGPDRCRQPWGHPSLRRCQLCHAAAPSVPGRHQLAPRGIPSTPRLVPSLQSSSRPCHTPGRMPLRLAIFTVECASRLAVAV
jgi:hypothetical protein